MYKLAAIDLDGTLLNSYGEIPTKSKEILKSLQEKGLKIVLTSGRTIDSISTYSNEIGSNNYLIAVNGGLIYNMSENNIIYEKSISLPKALKIAKICEENSISYSIYTDKTIIANSLKNNVLYYYKENLKKEDSKKTSLKIVKNIYDYLQNDNDDKIMKILIADETQVIFNSILRKLSEVEDIEILDISHISRKTIENGSQEIQIEYYYTEISEKNVDKWFAIEYLANQLNINTDEIIAIGDNINDLKMLQNSGLGIAMLGSTPKVSSIANVITEFDNNNDGAALELQKYV